MNYLIWLFKIFFTSFIYCFFAFSWVIPFNCVHALNLKASLTYAGSIKFLNETETPAEDITEAVEEEDTDHQVFYTVGSPLMMNVVSTNNDSDGNPLGTKFKIDGISSAGSGKLTFTLRHEPKKPNTGLTDAGGSTDIEATFDIVVE